MNIPKRGCIFFQGKGFISQAIIEAQNIRWSGKSQWSHIGFVKDGIFYESTVKVGIVKERKKLFSVFGKDVYATVPKVKFVYGIYISDVGKRLKNWQKENFQIGFQSDFDLPNSVWETMKKYTEELKRKKVKYGGKELFGTLWVLMKWKLTKDPKKRVEILKKKNPFDTSDVYCIAFVNDAFKAAGINYIDPSIDSSVSTVDDGWYTKLKHRKTIVKA